MIGERVGASHQRQQGVQDVFGDRRGIPVRLEIVFREILGFLNFPKAIICGGLDPAFRSFGQEQTNAVRAELD